MPTNILLDAIRTRRGLKWGVPAMFLAGPYLLAASVCNTLIAHGGPGWLNLFCPAFPLEHDEVRCHGTRQCDPVGDGARARVERPQAR